MTDGDRNYTYAYDGDGNRISKTVDGVTTDYYYIDGKLLGLKKGQDTLLFLYDETDTVYGLIYNGTPYFYDINLQGDIIGIYDQRGNLVVSYTYDIWGALLAIHSDYHAELALFNPLLYRGYYYDFETGLYYLQSRYYDPTVGRFINADTQLNVAVGVLGYNLFAYCNNNPVKFADTDGHFPFFAITAAIGAVTGAIVGGVKAAKAGKSVLKGALKGAAVGGLIGLGAGAAAGALLAGSVTASVTSVVIGAKAVASVVGGAGIVAGAKMLLDNASQACSSASQVFWSGGDVAKEAAKQVANDIGGKTLEMTRLGTYLEQTDASYSVWQAASENFANVASNSSEAIYSIQNVTGVSLQSTWATIEYPLLQGKDIIYGVASQGGSIQIMQ